MLLVNKPQDPKRLGTLNFHQCSPEDLSKYAVTRKARHPIEKDFREAMEKERLPTKMAPCHFQNLHNPTESKHSRHYNQDKGNFVSINKAIVNEKNLHQHSKDLNKVNQQDARSQKPAQDKFSLSVNPNSVKKLSKASSNKAYKEVKIIPEQQIPIQIGIKKQGTPKYVSRSETNNTNDTCKADGTMHLVKRPQDPNRQSTLQIYSYNPKDLSKYEIAKKVRNIIKENIKHTPENSKQSLPKMERKEKLPTKTAACHVQNLHNHTESNYSMDYNQDDGNCVTNGTANDGDEDLSKHSIALDMINDDLKDDVAHSIKPKSKQRSANASSNKGKNTEKQISHKKYQKKHHTQVKKNKSERSEHNSNNIALHLKRNATFRRKKSKRFLMENSNKNVDYRKAHRKNQRGSVDPSIYHANIEFTNPEYISMCEMIDNLIKEDKASQRSTLSLELPQDTNSLHDQKFTKKPCAVTSQNEQIYSGSQVIEAEIKIPNQKRKRDIGNDYGKAQNLKRLSKPDHLLPKAYQRERYSERRRHIHYHQRRSGAWRDADYHKASEFKRDWEQLLRRKYTKPYPDNTAKKRSHDRSTNGHKYERSTKKEYGTKYNINNGKSHREDFERIVRKGSLMLRCQDDFNKSVRQRNTELPSRNHQKGIAYELTNAIHTITDTNMVKRQEKHRPDLKITETKEPRLLEKMQRESQNASANVHQASMPFLATSSKEGRALKEGGSNEMDDTVNIQIDVFNRNNQRINPNRRDESIYSWFELWIQIVPGNKMMQDDKLQQITFLTGGTNPRLVFREWGYVTRSMKCKSLQVLSFTQRNNTLKITVYTHAVGLWACVKEATKSACYQREKCFITSEGHNNATCHATRDVGRFETYNARDSYEFVDVFRAQNERNYEQKPGYKNCYATSRRQYWDARARIIRREHEAQNDLPNNFSHPGNNFSRDGSYFD
ncbi:uncharacterized protein LOC129456259 [Periophthalmus magnuspinnatus]|uniref:uncharacterized protein LOC129456259 n=1 Tax=Periophthalmus magnuspinnatus TaxID=409849 RepID=UPI002436F223|nr:uncharacterized protein LOC129456259 [Periophthalmus magnuspinnatus]